MSFESLSREETKKSLLLRLFLKLLMHQSHPSEDIQKQYANPVMSKAFLVTRGMEDFVTWVDGSKIKRNILKYRDQLDDFDLM